MSPREKRIIDYINQHWAARGCAPSIRLVRDMLDENQSSIYRVLERLRDRGYIEWEKGVKHSLRTTGICPCCRRKPQTDDVYMGAV